MLIITMIIVLSVNERGDEAAFAGDGEGVALFRSLWYTFLRGEKMKLRVVLEPQKEGGFTVTAPSLPGCISQGETEKEALKNIREAIELYLEPIEDEMVASGQRVIKELVV